MFYKSVEEAKNNSKIPVFNSGRPAHSKYNPEREAENFLPQAENFSFAIILGAGGGYHIQSLLKRNPQAKIIAVEKSAEDLDFLKKNIPCVSELFGNGSVIFCAAARPNDLEDAIVNNYLPAYYGDLQIAALRPWAQEDEGFFQSVMERIKGCLKKISADYSVQARFGGLWQKNIFCNLQILKKMQESPRPEIKVDASKRAAIIAAGPSLDKSLKKLEAEREKYFVIATDTGYKILKRRNIKVDAAVSIDAQCLSAEHFNAPFDKDTIFVLDLAGNHSIANFVFNKGGKIVFTNGGNPLISFAGLCRQTPFPRLQSGGGTVTIAALDFAKSCGFSDIDIFGADFAYSQGKPYAKGSYLDDLYKKDESRVNNSQSAYTRLMFRTPLEKNAAGFLQNDVLLSYQKSLEDFLGKGNFSRTGFEYNCRLSSGGDKGILAQNKMDFDKFKAALKKSLEEIENSDALLPQLSIILPCMAFFKTKASDKISTKDAKKLALERILLYNNRI